MSFPIRPFMVILSLLLTRAISACAQQTPAARDVAYPQVTLPDTEVRNLKSAVTGRSYDLYVLLPGGYRENPQKRYPVLYLLDGQWDFKLLVSIYGGLVFDEFVPEMIIVGITYSGASPDYGALRAMDYSPVPVPALPGSGDAPKFLSFIKEELIPFVETNYRAAPSRRMLMGSSFGGTFTLYAMLVEPKLFSGYVASSPAVDYGDRFAFKQEAEYASAHQDLPVRLFLSVGEVEDLAQPVEEFMQIIRDRGYAGLELETRVIAGERHSGNKPESFNRGLRFVFQGN